MNESWYIVRGGKPEGPFDRAAVAALIAQGLLASDAQTCRVGEQAWRMAGQDPALAAMLGIAVGGGVVAPREWSFGAGWQATIGGFKRSWGMLMLLALVAVSVSMPGSLISQALSYGIQQSRDPATGALLALASLLVSLLNLVFVTIPIQQAGLTFAASRAEAGTVRISDLFQGYRRLGMVLATGVVLGMGIGVAVLVACIPGGVLIGIGAAMQGNGSDAGIPVIVVGALLLLALLLAALWFVFPWIYAPVVACDPAFGRPDFGECFRISAQGLRGRVFGVVGFILVIGLLAAASVLLLCIGYLLVGIPLLLAAQGAIYGICVRSRAPGSASDG